MKQFKVGDRVKLVKSQNLEDCGVTIGLVGSVKQESRGDATRVGFDLIPECTWTIYNDHLDYENIDKAPSTSRGVLFQILDELKEISKMITEIKERNGL